MWKQVWQFVFCPSLEQKRLANIAFFSAVLGTGLLTGSLITAFLLGAAVWPLIWLVYGRFATDIPTGVWAVAIAFLAFFLVEAILGLALGGPKATNEILENIPFLAILPMWVSIVAAPRQMLRVTSLIAAGTAALGLIIASTSPLV